jgi:hypothetical protein
VGALSPVKLSHKETEREGQMEVNPLTAAGRPPFTVLLATFRALRRHQMKMQIVFMLENKSCVRILIILILNKLGRRLTTGLTYDPPKKIN